MQVGGRDGVGKQAERERGTEKKLVENWKKGLFDCLSVCKHAYSKKTYSQDSQKVN